MLALVAYPLGLPAPAGSSLVPGANLTLSAKGCLEDANAGKNKCGPPDGKNFKGATCTGSSGLGPCCSAAGVVRHGRRLLRRVDAGRLQPQQRPLQAAPRDRRAAREAPEQPAAVHPGRQRRQQQVRPRPGQAAGAIVQRQPRPWPVLLGLGLVRRRRRVLRHLDADRLQSREQPVPRVPRPDPEERGRRKAGDVAASPWRRWRRSGWTP